MSTTKLHERIYAPYARREALRCLKRRLSDVVYKALLAGPNPLPQPDQSPDAATA